MIIRKAHKNEIRKRGNTSKYKDDINKILALKGDEVAIFETSNIKSFKTVFYNTIKEIGENRKFSFKRYREDGKESYEKNTYICFIVND